MTSSSCMSTLFSSATISCDCFSEYSSVGVGGEELLELCWSSTSEAGVVGETVGETGDGSIWPGLVGSISISMSWFVMLSWYVSWGLSLLSGFSFVVVDGD